MRRKTFLERVIAIRLAEQATGVTAYCNHCLRARFKGRDCSCQKPKAKYTPPPSPPGASPRMRAEAREALFKRGYGFLLEVEGIPIEKPEK